VVLQVDCFWPAPKWVENKPDGAVFMPLAMRLVFERPFAPEGASRLHAQSAARRKPECEAVQCIILIFENFMPTIETDRASTIVLYQSDLETGFVAGHDRYAVVRPYEADLGILRELVTDYLDRALTHAGRLRRSVPENASLAVNVSTTLAFRVPRRTSMPAARLVAPAH
jgi:hypothetical protein